MKESRLWHILIVLSSIRTCIKFFEDKATSQEYLRMRMFPNNFQFIKVPPRVEEIMNEARSHELLLNKVLARICYSELEREFVDIFYQEIEHGIPSDVLDVKEDDPEIGDIKSTLLNLMT